LNPSGRREIARWIAEGKQRDTRLRRAEQMAERLMETIEAERELPPLIKVALANNPKATAGWKRMPPSHRRFHLLGIFGYRNPESRARRLAKAVAEMVEYAERGTSRDSEE
ncbi:MAG TPA: YdeI/OmpD-associated family protein, partial [Alphaproteobacteria bacterium]|nr:YdeI/OmpD-associated family protein [Alphaproteobacteria bacterium]